jgi:hypothetical protein
MTEDPVVLPLANFEFHETRCSRNHIYEPEGTFYIQGLDKTQWQLLYSSEMTLLP